MKEFKLWNNIIGWVVFLVAAFTYIMTSEPTASLWDCGEYISTAYKLQVGHPPGAPFFQLVGNFFSLFAPSVKYIARMVNTMSALASAFSILFLFWSITHLARKFFSKEEKLIKGNLIAILMSGAVGALAYTFSDSFWFSAVEGEVYAMSSFFTAIVFWAMLKWEDTDDEKAGFKWIILIAYLVGLSIGVHLLNLLAIPAITFIYYFKKYKTSVKGIIITSILSIILLAVVMYMIIPWVILLAGTFERFFVNSFGLPFHTGTVIYFMLLFGGIAFGLWYTHKKSKVIANVIILSVTFIIIGYSSFFILVVRSNANTPIDENNPEDALSLLAYLNREQYGDWPLFSGNYYNAPVVNATDGNPTYTKSFAIVDESKLANPGKISLGDPGLVKIFQTENEAKTFLSALPDKSLKIKQAYVITDLKKQREPVYDERFVTVFPRMWSNQRSVHASAYEQYITDKSNAVEVALPNGSTETRIIPSFGDNLKFFFRYQIGYMYTRYFMWNFSGRQNDVQGMGEGDKLNGNWITGIKFLDEARLGPQDDIPYELRGNKGNNKYFMLPLILGLIGLFYQMSKNYKDGIVVMFLFLMTGLAIVVYLNQYPYQPRERDYAYAASFYAFAIWIGLGVLAIYRALSKYGSQVLIASATGTLCLLLVPTIMAEENWDDHDRSGRYNTLNIAINYLESCAPNAILFTNGDNDTFPLWYAQEVEGIRTDVKIVNLSLFNTDWYIDQMVRKTYNADPIPITVGRDKYIQGTNDFAGFYESGVANKDEYYDIRKLLDFFFSDDPKTKLPTSGGELSSYIPTNKCMIPVDKEKILKLGVVGMKDSANIVDAVRWVVNEGTLNKNNLMMMEMLATFKWERPVYYAITTGADAYLNLMEYFRLDGMAYRLVPIKNTSNQNMGSYGSIDTKILYDNMMNKFKYDGINNPAIYFDENHMRSIKNYRSNFARLASTLVEEGKLDSAKVVLKKAEEVLPEKTVPYDYFMIPIAKAYYQVGDSLSANKILMRLTEVFGHDLGYYYNPAFEFGSFANEKNNGLFIMQSVGNLAKEFNQKEIAAAAELIFQRYYQIYQSEQGPRQ